MMAFQSVDGWTVFQLKNFLKARDIPFSNYNKAELVKLVEKCLLHPHLVKVREVDDDERVQITRRSVEVNGMVHIFPDPLTINSWQENLEAMPPVTTESCLFYLIFKMKWSQTRVTNWKKERGYKLHQENHIQSVRMTQTIHGLFYIKSKCIRQTAQREAPYDVWILVTEEGSIETAGCQCIG